MNILLGGSSYSSSTQPPPPPQSSLQQQAFNQEDQQEQQQGSFNRLSSTIDGEENEGEATGSFEDEEDEIDIYSFGQNAYGELGHGDSVERHRPVPIAFCRGKKIVAACAGNEHTALLSATGETFVVGYNDSGQCGVGHTARVASLTPLEALSSKRVSLIHSANGCEHLCAVTEDGELYTCGFSSRGQTGHNINTSILVPRLVDRLLSHRVSTVACSYYHTICSTSDDLVFAVGRGDYGQLGLGDTSDRLTPALVEALSNRGVLSLACGQYHTCVATSEEGVYTFGKNDYGQLGIEQSQPRLLPGAVASPLTDLPVIAVSCGYYHTMVLTATHSLFSFGRNDYGQLGLGTRENGWRPQELKELLQRRIIQVTAGCYHTLVLDDEGVCLSFGRDNHGQLGRGKGVDSPRPLPVVGLQDRFVTSIAAGFYHSLVIATRRSGPGPLGAGRGLAADLRRLLDSDRLSDVQFVVEGQRIRAHRCLLVARCEPLARMLEGPMREGTPGVDIPMPGVPHKVFLAFLEFLYSDEVAQLNSPGRLDLTFAMDLLSLADQYLLDSLKRKCEHTILKMITASNVALMLATADARGAIDLRRRCMDYILTNFSRVIATPAFAELPTALLHEVLLEASRRGVQIGGGGGSSSSNSTATGGAGGVGATAR